MQKIYGLPTYSCFDNAHFLHVVGGGNLGLTVEELLAILIQGEEALCQHV
jgi:hypothetical protein